MKHRIQFCISNFLLHLLGIPRKAVDGASGLGYTDWFVHRDQRADADYVCQSCVSLREMIYGPDASNCPIKKQVLNAGKAPLIDFCDDMKVGDERAFAARRRRASFRCTSIFSPPPTTEQ